MLKMKDIKSEYKESYMPEIDIKEIVNTKKAWVYLRDILVGELKKCDEKTPITFKFTYFKEYLESQSPAIARAFPKRKESYISSGLHPFFDNLIVEGWLLTYTEKALHISKLDRFGLLMAIGSAPIGAVSVQPFYNQQPVNMVDVLFDKNAESKTIKESNKIRNVFHLCPSCFRKLKRNEVHRKCAIAMWGTTRTLKLKINKGSPDEIFGSTIYGGSVSGHQKKGMFRINSRTGELLSTPTRATYILKPSGYLLELPENEHVTMAIARALKFPTPPFDLLEFESIGRVFAIRRFDRSLDDRSLMQEDMCQVIGILSDRKYDLSYEQIANVIRKYSSAPQIDLYDFYRRLVFCYLVLNGDMHLKNWSLLENQKDLGSFILAPCYDLLNTRLPLPKEKSDIALQLNGKDRNLTKKNFSCFGKYISLSHKNIDSVFSELSNWLQVIKEYISLSLLSQQSKRSLT